MYSKLKNTWGDFSSVYAINCPKVFTGPNCNGINVNLPNGHTVLTMAPDTYYGQTVDTEYGDILVCAWPDDDKPDFDFSANVSKG